MYMERVGIAELRQNISRHLHVVKQGKTILVTEHNVPVAKIVPLDGRRSRIDQLVQQGRLTPPRDAGPLPRPLSIPGNANAASAALQELRNQERW